MTPDDLPVELPPGGHRLRRAEDLALLRIKEAIWCDFAFTAQVLIQQNKDGMILIESVKPAFLSALDDLLVERERLEPRDRRGRS